MTDQSPDTIAALKDKETLQTPRSQWIDVWEQLKHHKGALFGGGFLIFITLAVIFMPYIWQIDAQNLDIRNKICDQFMSLFGMVMLK